MRGNACGSWKKGDGRKGLAGEGRAASEGTPGHVSMAVHVIAWGSPKHLKKFFQRI